MDRPDPIHWAHQAQDAFQPLTNLDLLRLAQGHEG